MRLSPRFFQLTGDAAEQYDFAVVTLSVSLGKETGWLGLHWTNDTTDLQTTITGVRFILRIDVLSDLCCFLC